MTKDVRNWMLAMHNEPGLRSMHLIVLFLFACIFSPTICSRCCNGQSCSIPQTPKQLFDCPAKAWTQLIKSFPPDWYLNPIAQSFEILKRCQSGNKTYSPCTKDADCNGIVGSCAPRATSSQSVINKYMACCRYCVWDMQYPMGAPIQVAPGPSNQSNELYMIPTINCVNFPKEWAGLDTNGDNRLSSAEFTKFFSTLPNRELVAQGMLNQTAVELAVDLNKDGLISYQEYLVLRHFWTPVLISSSGPAAGATGTAAAGPLGGLYYDKVMISVWVTTANNIMLRLYITNDWPSSGSREPLDGEEATYVRTADLDGSGLISLEEHYFRTFADLDADGQVNETEYQLSLYADALTLKNGTRYPARYTFADHDLDGSGAVSFLERKRLAADLNADGALDPEEWRLGDFPQDADVFTVHASAAGVIGPAEYQLYRIFDLCTLRRYELYNPAGSAANGHPWNYRDCVLNVITFETAPFVSVGTGAARRRRELPAIAGGDGAAAGRRDGAVAAAAAAVSLSGFTPSVWSQVVNGLGFSQQVSLRPGPENASLVRLAPPSLDPHTGAVTLQVALLNLYHEPPAEWACTGPLWPDDGFVVLVRAAPTPVNLYLIVLNMTISPQFVNFFSSLFFLLLGVGHVIWLIECWGNELQFRKFYAEGVMDGLWWAIVTQTTNGFGDKAPASLPGKAFTVFWMIFGLITFAIFAGQATSYIGVAVSANQISDFFGLAGFSVGVPDGSPGAALSQAFAFAAVPCGKLKACADALLAGAVDAVVAPRADVVHLYVAGGLNSGPCGNPTLIVGQSLPPGYLPNTAPALQACTHGAGALAGGRLADALSAELARLTADGTLATLAGQLAEFQSVGDSCIQEPTYFVPLNAAAAAVLGFVVLGRTIERWYFRPPPCEVLDMGDVAQSIIALTRKRREDAAGAAAEPPPPPLPDLDGVDELVGVTRRVGLFNAMQSGSVRKMQRELRKQKNLLTSVVKLMFFAGASVACGLAMVVGLLIAIWSDKIQISEYTYQY